MINFVSGRGLLEIPLPSNLTMCTYPHKYMHAHTHNHALTYTCIHTYNDTNKNKHSYIHICTHNIHFPTGLQTKHSSKNVSDMHIHEHIHICMHMHVFFIPKTYPLTKFLFSKFRLGQCILTTALNLNLQIK